MRNRDMRARRGFSLIELLIVIAIILIIITMAVPKFNQAKKFANETAAIRAIQAVHSGETMYQSQYGRYATSLAELGPPQSGAASPSAADVIGNDLAGGEKLGYKFTVTGSQGGYVVIAIPSTFGTTGSRTFYSDQTMVIRENYSQEPPTAASKEIGTSQTGK
ncbi:MAG: prepilin-type N-terminal cleavage/methylation domain-containing protein [Acidobacteriia bacterium]|nr:prepilin-type N-terminal cleavage/methylation domain-containing protein [Terriglobia bacterium]